MHITCLIYHFLEAALFWDVSTSFCFFLLIVNREPDGAGFISANDKRLQNQVYRQIKNKLMDTFESGKSSPFEKVEFSLYHFLSSLSKFNCYSDSTQTFAVAEATFYLTWFMFALFFC